MPFEGRGVMSRRIEFCALVLGGSLGMSEACRRFKISRPTGYKWKERAKRSGLAHLAEESRRPRRQPGATRQDWVERILAVRDAWGWGGRKLADQLGAAGGDPEPITVHPRTIDRILAREGRIPREKRSTAATKRFARATPNELWQMDHKGALKVGRCTVEPLTILDDHSRFVLSLTAQRSTAAEPAWKALVATFRAYGMPEAILVDHGSAWYSMTNGHGLTWLSVELIKRDIRLIYSGIGHPETQGKVERFHRTLKRELLHQGWPATLRETQPALDRYRQRYNTERPHEALGMQVPAGHYEPSPRDYIEQPRPWEYAEGANVRRLDGAGAVTWDRRRFFVCEALANEWVCCKRYGARLLVSYRSAAIRDIDLKTGKSVPILPSARDWPQAGASE